MGILRFTAQRAKALGYGPGSFLHFTQLWSKAATQRRGLTPDDGHRMTRMRSQTMCQIAFTNPDNGLKEGLYVTGLRAKVMRVRMPNFEWIDMFIDEIFPYDISYNSQASTVFATDVIQVDSGHTQRISRWSQPLMSYNVAYGVRTMEHLMGLIEFFRVMQGQKHAFRYEDIMDHTSTKAVDDEVRRAPPPSPFDQWLGDGDGEQTVFQLRKGYKVGSITRWRPIYKPQTNSVQVSLNNVPYEFWECDHSTGKITFLPPVKLTAGIYPGTITVTATSGAVTFTGNPGLFNAFNVGDRIETFGFPDELNNTLSSIPVYVTAKAGDGSSITTGSPGDYGVTAAPSALGNIQVHPAPKAGDIVKAGFKFHVPVRFNTDELPTSLEYYGVGSALNLRLMEVRPYEGEV